MKAGGVLVSADIVADETLTHLRSRLGLRSARQWWDVVEASPRLTWENVDAGRAEKARRWFFGWKDRDVSFTDCTSFVVMRERRIQQALTSGRHSSQAGFQVVPG